MPARSARAGSIAGDSVEERFERVLDSVLAATPGAGWTSIEAVYESELETGHRNRAIGHMLRTFGILDEDPNETLDLYFRQCAIAVDCRDVSLMAATLANGGINPVTGRAGALRPARRSRAQRDDDLRHVRLCRRLGVGVGMPAKSGVGGGVMAVLPGQLGRVRLLAATGRRRQQRARRRRSARASPRSSTCTSSMSPARRGRSFAPATTSPACPPRGGARRESATRCGMAGRRCRGLRAAGGHGLRGDRGCA